MRSRIISLSNTWHFYAILIALLGLSLISLWYLLVLVIYLIYLYKIRFLKFKHILLFIGYATILCYLYLYLRVPSTNTLSGIVINVKANDNYQALTVRSGIKKYLVYYYGNEIFSVGTKATFTGTFNKLDYSSYSMYLKSQGIYNIMRSYSANVIQEMNIYSIKGAILKHYSTRLDSKSFMYLKSLVFAQNEFDTEIKSAISNLGISYLFCISGFHISIIASFFERLLSKITKNSIIKDLTIIIILFFYAFLCNFPYGIMRAILMYALTKLNFYKQLNLSKLDICSLSFIVIVLINPMALYSLSLRLSYIVTFFIIIGARLINDRSKIRGNYKMALLAFLVSAPLVISISNQLNLITIAISPIVLAIFSTLILPTTYILLVLPWMCGVSRIIFKLFEMLIIKLDSLSIFIIKIPTLTPIMIIAYYAILLFIFIKIETKSFRFIHSICFLALCLLFINYNVLIPYDRVIMLDVGQGDSILISRAFNKGNILIDSYNNLDKLDEIGINKIDTLIITHSDNDHISTALDVVKKYKVECLISSVFDSSEELERIEKNVKKSLKVSGGDTKFIADVRFDFLGPKVNNSSLNNNSLVFKTLINKTTILFTGDMEDVEEEQIFDQNIKADILKVPHHGSNSSMSDPFLNHCSYNDAIISVGKNNKFGHPNQETLQKLVGCNVYRTDEVGNICINIYANKYTFDINKNKNTIFI